MQKKSIIIDNLIVVYYQSDDFNPAEPLVFLHGWQSEALHLENIFNKCQNFIAPDLPGFGSSELPKQVWGLNEYSDFLDKFLSKLGISRPVLTGHSFGGSIILKYAASGFKAKKIILIDSSGIRKKSIKKIFYYLAAKIFKTFVILPGLGKAAGKIRNKFYERINSLDYLQAGAHKKIYQKIIKQDLTPELKKISLPADIIWGEDDAETPLSYARLMNRLINNSRIFIIKNAGHWPFTEQAEEFNKIFFNLI